jgi:acyl carrier protein
MANDQLVNELIALIEDCKAEKISLPEKAIGEVDMRDDLGFDSLDLIEILFRIEQDYSVPINGDELVEKNLLQLGKLADYIDTNQQ